MGQEITQQEIQNRWAKQITKRIYTDILLTDKRRFGRLASPHWLVEQTWQRILGIESVYSLSPSETSVFLVGTDSGRPPGGRIDAGAPHY